MALEMAVVVRHVIRGVASGVLIAALLTFSCAIGVPDEMRAYGGSWRVFQAYLILFTVAGVVFGLARLSRHRFRSRVLAGACSAALGLPLTYMFFSTDPSTPWWLWLVLSPVFFIVGAFGGATFHVVSTSVDETLGNAASTTDEE